MEPSEQRVMDFQQKVWGYYAVHARVMPWRDSPSPYHVLVSELMLQQTQVSRVIPKFEAFIEAFPDIETLAVAQLGEVLTLWSGLGYNRRAKYLHDAAKQVAALGRFPDTVDELVKLPGIGPNTAAAIMNYAFEKSVAFVETNIRTVYFHEIDSTDQRASDRQILEFVQRTLDENDPRHWFYALMDYGAMLKSSHGARLDQSLHYKKQSSLKGSIREVRGQILKALVSGSMSAADLRSIIMADDRYDQALSGLQRDGLVETHPSGELGLTGSREAS